MMEIEGQNVIHYFRDVAAHNVPDCSSLPRAVTYGQLRMLLTNVDGKFERPSIDMLLWCPNCGERHYDTGEFATKSHHTHACQGCGLVWRPAVECTRGVKFLPGFKNE